MPSGQGLIPASDQEVFADVFARNSPDGPWAADLAFHYALMNDDGPQLDVLQDLITPGSLAAWGDFSQARELLADTGMTSRADRPASPTSSSCPIRALPARQRFPESSWPAARGVPPIAAE